MPEAAAELGRVGVEREAEAQQLEPLLVRRPQHDDARRERCQAWPRPPPGSGVSNGPAVRHQMEAIGPARSDDVLDHRFAPYCSLQMRLTDAISLRSRRRKFAPLHGDDGADRGDDACWTSASTTSPSASGAGTGVAGRSTSSRSCTPGRSGSRRSACTKGRGSGSSYPSARYVQGDALELPFADGEFDVVFSNAVIEHVGGREQQRRFVEEALRVARRAFITTPNRWFPVEVHTLLPLVHWLPDSALAPGLRPRAQAVGEGELPARPGRAARALPAGGADRQPRPDAGGSR